MKHDWMAVDGGPGATVCHMWCANCGTLWEVADMDDPARTNRYFIAGWAPDSDASSRPRAASAMNPSARRESFRPRPQ